MKIIGFYHVADLPHWNEVMGDQMTKMSESGLLDRIDELHVCTNGVESAFDAARQSMKDFTNIHWHHVNTQSAIGEYPTLNFLKNYCDNSSEEFYVMYFHLKSLSAWGDANRLDWRHYMDYWQIERWEDCVKVLDQNYDTAGINYNDQPNVQNDNWPHYSGNFWWTRATYVRKLPQLNDPFSMQWGTVSKLLYFPDGKGIALDPGNYRYENEAWIGAANPAYFELAYSPGKTDHDYHKNHPWPRERFEDNVNPLLGSRDHVKLEQIKIMPGTSYTPAPMHDLKMPRILVDRRKALGDVLMITPVLKELRNRYGLQSWIQVVTEEPHALHNNPHVNAVVRPNEMKKEDPWDVYINLNDAYEYNPLVHYVDAYVTRAFGRKENLISNIDYSLNVFPTQQEIDNVQKIIQEQIKGDYIVVHMRRWAWENKNIDVNTWGSFFTLLNHHHPNVKVVSVGAQYDYHAGEVHNGISLVEKLSVGEIAALIGKAKCFVGGDSGPYHIAAATATPIVALLSHLYPEQILHWRDGVFGKNTTVVQSNVPCVGCYARQIDTPIRNLNCENEVQWACAKNFSFKEIYAAVEQYVK